jgi:hypothetical protein
MTVPTNNVLQYLQLYDLPPSTVLVHVAFHTSSQTLDMCKVRLLGRAANEYQSDFSSTLTVVHWNLFDTVRSVNSELNSATTNPPASYNIYK